MPAPPNIISEVQVAFSIAPTTAPLADEAVCVESGMYDLAQKDTEALGMQDPATHMVSYHSSLADATNGINALPKQYSVTTGTENIYVRVSSLENPRCFDASEQFTLEGVITPDLIFEDAIYHL